MDLAQVMRGTSIATLMELVTCGRTPQIEKRKILGRKPSVMVHRHLSPKDTTAHQGNRMLIPRCLSTKKTWVLLDAKGKSLLVAPCHTWTMREGSCLQPKQCKSMLVLPRGCLQAPGLALAFRSPCQKVLTRDNSNSAMLPPLLDAHPNWKKLRYVHPLTRPPRVKCGAILLMPALVRQEDL